MGKYLDMIRRQDDQDPQQPEAGEEVTIEPAMRPDGKPIKPVYWERSSREIVGPGQPEFFAHIGTGTRDQDYWVIVEFQGQPVWVRSDRLRSKKQFETQRKPQMIEPVKGLR